MIRGTQVIKTLIASMLTVLACSAQGADYRGAAAGWPAYPNGAYPANHVNAASGPAYYVARPTTTAYYPGGAPAAVRYVPVNAAYSNPAYFAAYRNVPAAARAPVAVGYYPATTANYAPAAGYYAPTTANYAPNYGYAVSPAGSASAGSEASVAYAQPMAMNYVPQRVAYRPAYAAVPVYAYRPVTAYDPILAQPNSCYQPAPAPTCQTQCQPQCQPQCRGLLSRLNPFNWFRRSCGTSGCGSAPQPTTAYCTSGCAPVSTCGQQPYYPTTPVVPYVPGPIMTSPPIYTNPLPSGPIPSAGPRVPSPPTRVPGFVPADGRPSLTPGSTFVPGTTITPGPTTTFPTAPGGSFTPTAPGGSFPTAPSGAPGSFGPSSNFPSGTNYSPATDPYGSTNGTSATGTVVGSGFRSGNTPARGESTGSTSNGGLIRAPGAGTGLPPGVTIVPDLDIKESPRPTNRAPQLIDPRDKSARATDPRWAVVPAVWATKQNGQPNQQVRTVAASQPVSFQPQAADYDDGGWQSAR